MNYGKKMNAKLTEYKKDYDNGWWKRLPKEEKNIFLVRCSVEGGPQTWWRPGMSGLCKFNVEKRTLFWIFTHRTVDFLRMWLWW